MATPAIQAKTRHLMRHDREMFWASEDPAIMKQIQETHAPDGGELEAKPILRVIEEILHQVSPEMDGVINGTHHEDGDAMEEKAAIADDDGILDGLARKRHTVSSELSCKCSGGGDAHSATTAILNKLSSYSWDAKAVTALASFAVNYGEFWLLAKLLGTNPLAKSIAALRHLSGIREHFNALKSQFDDLIKVTLDVTKCIVEIRGLPGPYIADDTPPMEMALAHIPSAVYRIIRSMVVCASLITSLLPPPPRPVVSGRWGRASSAFAPVDHEMIGSTTEEWEISNLAHKLSNIHGRLKTQLAKCHKHIDKKKHDERYQLLIHIFDKPHVGNSKILSALTPRYPTKEMVDVDLLGRKTVLLLISDLDLSQEDLPVLTNIYPEAKSSEFNYSYEIVWLPIVSVPWDEPQQEKFTQLQSRMPWNALYHPSTQEPAVAKYVKEVWHFEKKMMLVVFDPQGNLACRNALHMVWIWGNLAYPFTMDKEKSLWKKKTWRLELLIDENNQTLLNWISQGKFICLYGGQDIEWIRQFTNVARRVAAAAGISLEMVYVGSKSNKERARRNDGIITKEQLSHTWNDPTYVRSFWTRVESIFYSKMQLGKSVHNDKIMEEALTILTFDGSENEWALFGRKSAEIARAKGDTMLKSLTEFQTWEDDARKKGFIPALNDRLTQLHTPHHCNRLILTGITGGIRELVVCAECRRPMDKHLSYRCCTE